MNKSARHISRLACLLLGLVLACSFILSSFTPASARKARRTRVLPISAITLDASLSYSRAWGDNGEGQTFGQSLSTTVSGYGLDPRLMTFSLGLVTANSERTGLYRGGGWNNRVKLDLVFFKGINRNRGLKVWRYVPSPLSIGYTRSISKNQVLSAYRLSMYYSRDGYIRFFSSGKLAYFDDGKKRDSSKGNRYRLKYQNNSFNYNRNGNGNWNRNGNGNWNRNGNGNWNRNGNGNWNRNGNGNWNRNGNGNWDRNGNGNGNGSSNFFTRGQGKPRAPLGFAFPHISLDISGGDIQGKGGYGKSYSYDALNFRIDIVNSRKEVKGSDIKPYRSNYYFTYRTSDSSGGFGYDSMEFAARNIWEKLSVSNDFSRRNTNYSTGQEETETSYVMSSTYSDRYKKINYIVDFGGLYASNNAVTTYQYGIGLRATTGLTHRKRLTPLLESTTTFSISLGRGRDVVTNGKRVSGSILYSVGVNEKLEYYRFRRFPITVIMSTSVRESGVPFSFTLAGETRGFRKWKLRTRYFFATQYNTANEEPSRAQSVDVGFAYSIKHNLAMNHNVKVVDNMEEDGKTLSYNAGLQWRISGISSLKFEYMQSRTSSLQTYAYTASYKTRLGMRTSVSAYMGTRWDDAHDGKDEFLTSSLNWPYRQFVFSAKYLTRKTRDDMIYNEVWVKASRGFILRMRGRR